MWAYQPLLPVEAPKKKWKRLKSVDFSQAVSTWPTANQSFSPKSAAANDEGTLGVYLEVNSATRVFKVTQASVGADPTFTEVSLSIPSSRSMIQVIYFAKKFYLITDGLGIFSSENVDTWTQIRAPDASGNALANSAPFATNGEVWITAVGVGGQIWTSTDLVNWNNTSSGATLPSDVIWDGTQFVCCAADNVYTSPDGQVWTLVYSSLGSPYIEFANGYYYAATSSPAQIKRSSNLTSWSTVFTFSSSGACTGISAFPLYPNLSAVPAFVYHAITSYGAAALSLDGASWTDIAPFGSLNDFNSRSWPVRMGTSIIAKAITTKLLVTRSKVTWTEFDSVNFKKNTGKSLSNLRIRNSIADFGSNGSYYSIVNNPDNSVAVGTFAPNFPARTFNVATGMESVAAESPSACRTGRSVWYYNGEFYLLESGSGAVIRKSSDGITWNIHRASGASLNTYLIYASPLTSPDGTMWICPGSNNDSYYLSSDGINWGSILSIAGAPNTFPFRGLTWDIINSRWFVVTSSSYAGYWSTDGLSWTSLGTCPPHQGIFAQGYYFAWTIGNVLQRTTTFSSWTNVPVTGLSGSIAGLTTLDIDGYSCLICISTTGYAYASTDAGSTWTNVSGSYLVGINAVGRLGNKVFAIGQGDTRSTFIATNDDSIPNTWVDVSDRFKYYEGASFVVPEYDSAQLRPLDNYTTGMWGCYSSRKKLRSSYSGPAIRVRRASDDAELDVGFVATLLDRNTLDPFLDGTTGYVVTCYDQSGNLNHLTCYAQSRQPALDTTTRGHEFFVFDGTDDQFMTPYLKATPDSITVVLRGNLRSTATRQTLVELTDDYTSNVYSAAVTFIAYYESDPGAGLTVAAINTNTNSRSRSHFGNSVYPVYNTVHAYRVYPALSPASLNETNFYANGVYQTRTANGDGTDLAGTFANARMFIGARGRVTLSRPANLDLYDLIIYTTVQDDATIMNVSQELRKL